MQFMVTAYDRRDTSALARRREARPAHLKRIEPYVKDGSLVFAAALLDDDGRPTGSIFSVEMNTLESLHEWIKADPYTEAGVWEKVDVRPVRIGVRNGAIEV